MAEAPDPNPVALSLPWGEDLILTNYGGLAFCSGVEKLRQRVIRRFFTCPEQKQKQVGYIQPDYIFDPKYGVGAIRMVGQPISPQSAAVLEAKVRAAVMVDEGVDSNQQPVVKLFAAPNGQVWVNVYVQLIDATRVYLNFPAQGNFYT